MTQVNADDIKFEGEDANSGHAPPRLDLIAAGFLFALAVVVMVASLRLPVPGTVLTAPGLLPFIAAGSLAAMAVLLGLSALRRHRAGVTAQPEDIRDVPQDKRTVALAGTVALYILALQVLAFQVYFSIGSVPFVLSAFEPVTVLALAAIIHTSWRGPLWITVLTAMGWTLALSLTFQKLFNIPLPGGF
ncbi:Tripartite tricarboxylate transporter TctB family protein [Thalassovita gelatinovora]|uniref:Tripartite tricarboxylate transporter TctB family protein n=1 Tax=Thalassovita gelatinovora TaxID=53501 RepID=A0A0P1FJJ0_THAGE|nr:tripartite tricarboxylate transporter TctB family protein [Thalassovita gelatinovora]QIZ81613.1 tripartite tricarboxylate transporter TctB family protein [Thalassovita gelatinovora]CUH68069.1 Tripartite tricarboxylate transporter TctB family protein [Thalassovita gelatinovora]SEQ28620.1 Tripartite tricarboxylate transporter TctB family protein [Thalassovita gelatinovora]